MFLDVPLSQWVREARQRTFDLIADLADEQLIGPRIEFVNPLLWEIGHVAWFQEKWVLRHLLGLNSVRSDADPLYNSIAISHATRWDLPLPTREATLDYMCAVRDRVLDWLRRHEPTREEAYFVLLSVFHEDMHTEAFTYTRQTLGYCPPTFLPKHARFQSGVTCGPASAPDSSRRHSSSFDDSRIPGGDFLLGASRDQPFLFDNEKWAHPVIVKPFSIARAPVTQDEFATFVDDGGYERRSYWSDDGWRWRQASGANHPVYWRQTPGGTWQRRWFDRWAPLEPELPIVHVNWYEAVAYCRWAGRRLPSEAEWEMAAAGEPTPPGRALAERKRRYPWGDNPPDAEHANLDWKHSACVDVAAFVAGDSAFGCRQMIGNVWEWTASSFVPYPGFEPDPYQEYSKPWFYTRKVLRGGCWASRGRTVWNTFRNFYEPHRRDVWAGFRTCALAG